MPLSMYFDQWVRHKADQWALTLRRIIEVVNSLPESKVRNAMTRFHFDCPQEAHRSFLDFLIAE